MPYRRSGYHSLAHFLTVNVCIYDAVVRRPILRRKVCKLRLHTQPLCACKDVRIRIACHPHGLNSIMALYPLVRGPNQCCFTKDGDLLITRVPIDGDGRVKERCPKSEVVCPSDTFSTARNANKLRVQNFIVRHNIIGDMVVYEVRIECLQFCQFQFQRTSPSPCTSYEVVAGSYLGKIAQPLRA
jgi:hypothetical protein